jgi:phosphatidylglycerophosphate synthase
MHLSSGMSRFPPTALGKATTITQTVTLCVVLLFNTVGRESILIVPAFFYLTLAITLASGFHYIYHATHRAAMANSIKKPT